MLDVKLPWPTWCEVRRAIRGWPRREKVLVAGALVYAGAYAFSDFRWWRPERNFDAGDNQNIVEARSWLHGRLDLMIDELACRVPNATGRPWDTALYQGKVYNHLPPLATLLFALPVLLCDERVPHLALLALTILAIPALALRVFLKCTDQVWRAALLALAFLLGTSVACLSYRAATTGHAYHVNQLLSTGGLLLLLGEYWGRRRVWLAATGLVIAFGSRQLTLAYALPLLWMAWKTPARHPDGAPAAPRPFARVAIAGLLITGMVGGTLLLNWLKFHDPLQSGYIYIYAGRDDEYSRNAAQYGIFSPHFMARNLYWTNLGLPRTVQAGGFFYRRGDDGHWVYGYKPRLRQAGWVYQRVNVVATGIWWTTPLLLYLFIDWRHIWRDPARRTLLVAAGLVFTGLLLYHGTGHIQSGYNRYSLDYLSPLFTIIAPRVFGGRRTWITLLLIGWSVLYFQWVIPQQSAW